MVRFVAGGRIDAMNEGVTLEELNQAPEDEAAISLRRCCGAEKWVRSMLQARPFSSLGDMFEKAEAASDELTRQDWIEAFSHHPRIGSIESLRNRFAEVHTREWSTGEQSGVQQASEEVLEALARGNEEYENKFGYIFIVCATGKSAQEMLALLETRLPHSPEEELQVAASEQRKITRLRLEKLMI